MALWVVYHLFIYVRVCIAAYDLVPQVSAWPRLLIRHPMIPADSVRWPRLRRRGSRDLSLALQLLGETFVCIVGEIMEMQQGRRTERNVKLWWSAGLRSLRSPRSSPAVTQALTGPPELMGRSNSGISSWFLWQVIRDLSPQWLFLPISGSY